MIEILLTEKEMVFLVLRYHDTSNLKSDQSFSKSYYQEQTIAFRTRHYFQSLVDIEN